MTLDRRQLIAAAAAAAVAPTAKAAEAPPLRGVWLSGNPVQARLGKDGQAFGPAYEVAKALAKKLRRPLEFTAVPGTETVLERVRSGAADIAFIAYDPARSAGLLFTAPYVMSANQFAVPIASKITSAAEVDRAGVKLGAIPADAGGLFLQRTLKAATLLPMASADAAVAELQAGKVDVIGANGQRLADMLPTQGGFRILPGSFFAVPQAVAVRGGQDELRKTADAVIAQMIASGGMRAVIKGAGLTGAELPPPKARPVTAAQAKAILAPTGKLRAAINYGNTVLAQRNEKTGALTGVSVVLARTLAQRLGVPVEFLLFPVSGQVFDALEKGAWDIAFMAVEPERAVKIDFTAPYAMIDGTYLVRSDAPFRKVADLDAPGVTIAVGTATAYDLYLGRNLKQARLKRAPTSIAAVEMFMADPSLAGAAGVRQVLVDASRGKSGYRVIEDRYSRIDQAMAVPKGRPAAGAAYVRAFLEEMKASGAVRKALDETGQDGAVVAPPA